MHPGIVRNNVTRRRPLLKLNKGCRQRRVAVANVCFQDISDVIGRHMGDVQLFESALDIFDLNIVRSVRSRDEKQIPPVTGRHAFAGSTSFSSSSDFEDGLKASILNNARNVSEDLGRVCGQGLALCCGTDHMKKEIKALALELLR